MPDLKLPQQAVERGLDALHEQSYQDERALVEAILTAALRLDDPGTPERFARAFHEAYERLAPDHPQPRPQPPAGERYTIFVCECGDWGKWQDVARHSEGRRDTHYAREVELVPAPTPEPEREEPCERCGGTGKFKPGTRHMYPCPDCKGTGTQAATEDPLTELPEDLAAVLRDQSVIVPQDARVFELIASWAKIKSDTPSADLPKPEPEQRVSGQERQPFRPETRGELYRPEGALYDEQGCCRYCHVRIIGAGGSAADRKHDPDCPVVILREAKAKLELAERMGQDVIGFLESEKAVEVIEELFPFEGPLGARITRDALLTALRQHIDHGAEEG